MPRHNVRAVVRLTGVLTLAAVVLAAADVTPAAADSTSGAASAAATASLDLLSSEVAAYAGPLGGYSDGIWNTTDTACWSCDQGGPATAAATDYMLTGRSNPNLLTEAERTINNAIATRQQPDGSFIGPPGDTQSASVATMFFGVEEGNTYLDLSPILDPATRARWQASLASAASYLVDSGNLYWYTNGNINLGDTELFYLAWQATGDPTFESDYEDSWSFTSSPPAATWPGQGLIITKQPTAADGSDGAGYLTETGAGGTGFDPEYTALQLDVASRMYLLSGDQRWLWLTNLLVNQLLPLIDTTDWMLNASNGTRHTESDYNVNLITSAFVVLGLYGGRTDLVPDILPDLQQLASTYSQSWTDYSNVYRRALGNDVSVIALATNLAAPLGWALDPVQAFLPSSPSSGDSTPTTPLPVSPTPSIPGTTTPSVPATTTPAPATTTPSPTTTTPAPAAGTQTGQKATGTGSSKPKHRSPASRHARHRAPSARRKSGKRSKTRRHAATRYRRQHR
jgi:hypothetical protein